MKKNLSAVHDSRGTLDPASLNSSLSPSGSAMKTSSADISATMTKDGSRVRELMHPAVHGSRQLSFAEAVVAPGAVTALHRHHLSEELYHISQGAGLMTLADEQFPVTVGDTVCILPAVAHRVENTGPGPLKIFCCCTPAYSHGDTELLAIKR